MSRRAWLWALLVFALTMLVELPARWLLAPLPVPLAGISGSIWQGQAERLGDLGPLRWAWQPWRARAQASAGYQGQRWQLQISGWPWRWHAALQPTSDPHTLATDYRLAGQWQGRIVLSGSAARCRSAEGQLQVDGLALQSPWQLELGQARLALDCSTRWKLAGQLSLAGQHHADLAADLFARQARLTGRVEPGAALQPLLVSAQWLAPGGTQVARTIRW
ncbi:type II secretion system protein N [Pseudomonas argentinensis]|uniref:Type II secretion system protein N (GspN) n=1 Tax=Phytopseudomonas argentinensis TaxID=289370 RepID=A0A1I3K1E8_9GAMM|nr:general secretion pathway protein GspN [Pseudomonas argentinensis]KAB0550862.1 type II secretion system protein N [Pseudomonas argentinensis]SFI66283.1 type II secretion system protein N (GspN) [Pseudomonas argentinensis]